MGEFTHAQRFSCCSFAGLGLALKTGPKALPWTQRRNSVLLTPAPACDPRICPAGGSAFCTSNHHGILLPLCQPAATQSFVWLGKIIPAVQLKNNIPRDLFE